MPYQLERIDSSRAAMIVVDMQNDFVGPEAPLGSTQALAMLDRLATTLDFCRANRMKVVYTAHVHRSDGSDLGRYGDLYAPIAERGALVEGTDGVLIHPSVAPVEGEHVVRKHRYSGFFATDLDLLLRGWGIDTVVISGVTTENCCHATARDALYRDYRVAFLSDATATFDYPDLGHGPLPADDVHRASLAILAFSTAHVMSTAHFRNLVKLGATE
jgi:nicotinamidase-related amidase